MDRLVKALLGLASVGLVACSDDGSSANGGDADGTATLSGGITVASNTGPKLDVLGDSMDSAGEAGPLSGCTKVDVVISVDNSSSMAEEIEALQGPVFDSFPQTLLDINNGLDDFHLGLIDACPKPAALQDEGNDGLCGYTTNKNYMVSSSPDLGAEFSCATELPFMAGWSGGPDMCEDDVDDDEQPGLTVATVVSAPFVDDHNEGFVRNDAVLMAVGITDEDERLADANDVQEIFDMMVAAKGGDVSRVAYLGIAGGSDCDGEYGSAQDATESQALAQLFIDESRGMFWDLCDGQLDVAFEMFIQTVVNSACEEFVPEG